MDGDRVGPLFRRGTQRQGDRVRAAVRGAVSDMVQETVEDVRDDIRAAGRFGSRWTDGFTGLVSEGGGNIRVAYKEAVPYWTVFQFSATIHGKPLLAIPLSFSDAVGIRARDYGPLFRVDRTAKGKKPLLFAFSDKQPKYFLTPSVFEPKRFHIIEIIRNSTRRLKDFYSSRFSKTP